MRNVIAFFTCVFLSATAMAGLTPTQTAQQMVYAPSVAANYGGSAPANTGAALDSLAARQNCGFYSATLASATAATPVDLVGEAAVPAGKKACLVIHHGYVSGSAFGALTECRLEDTAGNDFNTFDPLDLGNDTTFEGVSIGGATRLDPYRKGTCSADGHGIRFGCDSNGSAGSSIFINGMICIK